MVFSAPPVTPRYIDPKGNKYFTMTPKFDKLVNEWTGLAAKAGRVGYRALRKLKVPKGAAKYAVRNPKKLAVAGAVGVVGGAHLKRMGDQLDTDPGLACDFAEISREHPDCAAYITARTANDKAGRAAFRDKYREPLQRNMGDLTGALIQRSEDEVGHQSGGMSDFARHVSKGAAGQMM